MSSKIIIHLQGGLVHEVLRVGNGMPTEAIIVDEDTEGADLDEITTYTGKDGKEFTACIHTEAIEELPKDCDMDRANNAFENQ